MLGAEVMLLVVGGVVLAVLIPMLSALWATLATLAAALALVGVQLLGMERGRHGAAARRFGPDDRRDLRHEHGVRLFRRVALQAPVHRAASASTCRRSWSTRMAADPGEVQHGAEERRAHDPVRRRARLHRHLGGAQARGAARVHQRVPDRHERHHPQHATAARSTSTSATPSWRSGARRWTIAQHARNARARGAGDAEANARRSTRASRARGWPRCKIGVGRQFRHGARRRHGLAGAPRLHRDGRRGERRLAAGRAAPRATASASWSARPRAAAGAGCGVPRGGPHQGQGQGRGRHHLRAAGPRGRDRQEPAGGAASCGIRPCAPTARSSGTRPSSISSTCSA